MHLSPCGEASIQPQSLLTLPLRSSIHREVHTCFLPPPSSLWKNHLSPSSSGNSKLLTFQMLLWVGDFSKFCASGVPGWEMDRGFCGTFPFCVSRPCTDGWWEGLDGGALHVQDMRRHHPATTTTPASLGTLLSAHTSTQLHRCCCIVWSTKAQISPTGSFYSLAIVSVCLTRPLMNAAVSRRSDTRQSEQKMNQLSIWKIQFKI